MSGPYRSRLFRPESHDEFWKAVERRAKALRRAPKLIAALALLPALAIVTSAFVARAGDALAAHTLQRVVASPYDTPFGLFVSPLGSQPWRGPPPPALTAPDLEKGTVTAAQVQAAIARDAGDPLRACYQSALQQDPVLEGDLLVSVAVAPHGDPRAVSTGPTPLRAKLHRCAIRALENVQYPRPRHEPLWFTFPIRFSPR
jgi:hypothetical protein